MTLPLFRDQAFPPCMASIAPPNQEEEARRKYGGNIRWLRPRQIPLPPGKKPMLYSGKVSPTQIEQRRLGDCWFVGALATICTLPEFSNLELTYIPVEGKVTMKIYKHGQWRQIEIDDLLPCDDHGRLLFTASTEPGIYWMSFIEKAYAKIHGSYFALISGNPCDAMADLTGGIGTSVSLDFVKTIQGNPDDNIEYKKLFIKLEAYLELGLAAICASTEVVKYGIISNHAYSVMLAMRAHQTDGSEVKMVLFRNPHGSGTDKWTGPYAKADNENWNKIIQEDRTRMEELFHKDGYIWTDFQTFCELFETLSICNLPGKLKYDMQVFSEWKASTNSGCFCNHSNKAPYQPNIYLKVGASTSSRRVLISLSQRDPRMDIQRGVVDHKCNAVGLVLMKYPDATLQMPGRIIRYNKSLVVAESDAWYTSREILLEHIFEPGPAMELCIVPSTFDSGLEGVFRVRCMSATEIVLKTAQPFDEYWLKESSSGSWDASMKSTKKYPKFRFMARTSNIELAGKQVPIDIVVYQRDKDPQYIGIQMEGTKMPVLRNIPLVNNRVLARLNQSYDFFVPNYDPAPGNFLVDVLVPSQVARILQCRLQLGSVVY